MLGFEDYWRLTKKTQTEGAKSSQSIGKWALAYVDISERQLGWSPLSKHMLRA